MDPIAALTALASIAASLVGFTGLLTAFRANADTLSPNDVSNIRILLIFSVSALVFALLPMPVVAFAAPMVWWRALALLLGAFLIFWLVQSPRWMRRRGLRPRSPRLYWWMLVLQAAIGLAVVGGGIGHPTPQPFYIVGVLWCLLTAITVFVVQIFVMLPIQRDH